MRKIILLLIILISISCKKEKDFDNNADAISDVKAISKIINKRDFPIKNFSKIELISYYNRLVWDTIKYQDKHPFSKILVDNYRLTFDSTMIHERVILNKIQEKELLNLMVSDTCLTGELPSDCYKPRHMILFRDDKNHIVGYNEYCFGCLGGRNSSNLDNFQKYCYSGIEKLFKKFGIKFFVTEGGEGEEVKGENEEYDFLKSKGYLKN